MKKYEKVVLINSPVGDSSWDKSGDRADHYQPLGLLTVVSHLKRNGFEGEIKISDQAVETEEKIMEAMKGADLVGIASTTLSYPKGVELAKKAKTDGADVVLGGVYHSILAPNIMQRQEAVDFIIQGDGEQGLLDLVSGKEYSEVQNLVYRGANGEVMMNPQIFNAARASTPIDYSLIDLDSYFRNYRESFNPREFQRPFTVVSQKGCFWRNRTGGCKFCSRIDPTFSIEDPESLLIQFERLFLDFGIDCFIEMSDDITSSKEWLRRFVELKSLPRFKFMDRVALRFAMARAGNITPETADLLKALNTQELLFGFESGDISVLKKCRKGASPKQHIRAAKLLSDREIDVYGSFILGMAGESEETLGNTLEHIRELLAIDNMKGVSMAPLVPFPGSEFFEELVSAPDMQKKYAEVDQIDIVEMAKDWISSGKRKGILSISFDKLMNAKDIAEEMVEAKGGIFRKHKINEGKVA